MNTIYPWPQGLIIWIAALWIAAGLIVYWMFSALFQRFKISFNPNKVLFVIAWPLFLAASAIYLFINLAAKDE